MPENRPFRFRNVVFIIVVLVIGLLIWRHFSGRSEQQMGAHGPQGQGPMSVEVVTVKRAPTRIWNEFSGRLTAVDSVEVRPKVSGTISEVKFTEGATVKKGDLLFVIDPRPFEATVATAQAAISAAESQVQLANAEESRLSGLVEKNAISKSRFDSAKNTTSNAKAALDAARAQLKQAKLNLEFAHVVAPIDGQVGRAEITVGNVVQSGANAPILTTVVAEKQLYADFDVDEQTYINSVRGSKGNEMPVELVLAKASDIKYSGRISSFDNSINTASGTIRARALIDNTDGVLVPGMYATVRLGSAEEQDVLLIPDGAVGTDQSRKFVYVIDDRDTVQYQEVKLGHTLNGQRIVLDGLRGGERILINNLQKVQPKMPVKPTEHQPGQKTPVVEASSEKASKRTDKPEGK